MKKLIAILLLAAAGSAMAHGPHGHWRHGHGGHWHWVAPTIIGGVIGYEIARNQQPVIVQQPVVVPPPPVVVQQNCSPWTEIRNSDGSVTVTRTCTQ